MILWQKVLIVTFSLLNLVAFYRGYIECSKKRNAFGLANVFNLFGIFVWGDAVIIGLFWFLSSIVILFLNDWILFLLLLSLFWLVRGVGEFVYWLNQQFTSPEKNPPNTLRLYKVFHTDSIWFVYQVIWQCITVISLIASIYFTKLWLSQ